MSGRSALELIDHAMECVERAKRESDLARLRGIGDADIYARMAARAREDSQALYAEAIVYAIAALFAPSARLRALLRRGVR